MAATEVPVTIGREAAREAARRELADPAYHLDDESVWDRIWNWVLERLSDLLDAASAATPGGAAGLIVLLLVIAFVVVAIRLRVGPLARAARGPVAPLFTSRVRSADEYRRAAAAAFTAGDLAGGIRERFRAVVRDLEERGLLDPRPGRTADEAAAEAGRLFPADAAELAAAARGFDEVWYGDRPATEAAYHRLAEVDERLRAARPPATGVRP